VKITKRNFLKQAGALAAALTGGAYLTGQTRSAQAGTAPLRPPGALPEPDFLSTCIRCMRCVDACPNHCLESLPANAPAGRAGTPAMFPRKAACMLCLTEDGDYLRCTEVCPSGALQKIKKTPEDIAEKVHIGTAHIDFDLCYSYNNWSCGACYRACPLAGKAMTVGAWERPTIHPDACIGCGCCERSCIRYPHAIRVKPETNP